MRTFDDLTNYELEQLFDFLGLDSSLGNEIRFEFEEFGNWYALDNVLDPEGKVFLFFKNGAIQCLEKESKKDITYQINISEIYNYLSQKGINLLNTDKLKFISDLEITEIVGLIGLLESKIKEAETVISLNEKRLNNVYVSYLKADIDITRKTKEKLMKAGKALGHNIHIETQGTIGTEDELTKKDIENADVVIIAADIKVGGKERFAGKKIVEVPTSIVIKSPKGLLNKIQAELGL